MHPASTLAHMCPSDREESPSGRLAPNLPLTHLAIVEIKGPDAGLFLQGQLTQDAQSMSFTEARAGGYCNAKGRLLANFVMLHPDEQTWWLILHASLVESVAKRLKMFVLRAKCAVAARPDLAVFGSGGDGLPLWKVGKIEPIVGLASDKDREHGSDESTIDGAHAEWHIGWWNGRKMEVRHSTAANRSHDEASCSLSAWLYADAAAAWPWIEAATVEQFVPQMVNFELLGGVNFRKGCYPGQEVVARSQYRGTLKRRMSLFALEGDFGASPAAATELFHSEDPSQPAGMVVNAARQAGSEPSCLVLAEVKLAAQLSGTIHLGSPEGPILSPRTLPYRIPSESEM